MHACGTPLRAMRRPGLGACASSTGPQSTQDATPRTRLQGLGREAAEQLLPPRGDAAVFRYERAKRGARRVGRHRQRGLAGRPAAAQGPRHAAARGPCAVPCALGGLATGRDLKPLHKNETTADSSRGSQRNIKPSQLQGELGGRVILGARSTRQNARRQPRTQHCQRRRPGAPHCWRAPACFPQPRAPALQGRAQGGFFHAYPGRAVEWGRGGGAVWWGVSRLAGWRGGSCLRLRYPRASTMQRRGAILRGGAVRARARDGVWARAAGGGGGRAMRCAVLF